MIDSERELHLDLTVASSAGRPCARRKMPASTSTATSTGLPAVEPLGVDRLLQRADVDLVVVLGAATC